jgi:hypothetical protein
MKTNKYISSASPILSYNYGEDWISIEGANGYTHTFRYEDTGKRNVKRMIKCAKKGKGLSRFILKNHEKFNPNNRKWFFGLPIKAFLNLLIIKIFYPLINIRTLFSIINKRVITEVDSSQSNQHYIDSLSFPNLPNNKKVPIAFEDKKSTKTTLKIQL